MRGAWLGFSWSHTQAHFFRAVMEGVAFEYAYYLRILRELLPDLELTEARAVGGGARSRVWNQIKADVLGVPFQRLTGSEFGTWGAALIAAKAAGLVDNLAERAGEGAQPAGEAAQPNAEFHRSYQPMVDKYIRMENILHRFYSGE
jgi:xylulokinase